MHSHVYGYVGNLATSVINLTYEDCEKMFYWKQWKDQTTNIEFPVVPNDEVYHDATVQGAHLGGGSCQVCIIELVLPS